MAVNAIDLLEKYRVENRYSQSEMADLVGTSQPTYCRWLSGRAVVKAKFYKTIARVCGLPLREVLPPELRDGEE